MKLNEIETTYLRTRSDEQLGQLLSGSEQIGGLAGYQLYRKTDTTYGQEAYIYTDDDVVIGYVILEEKQFVNNEQWFLEELWIKDDPQYRRKGLAKILVKYVRDLKKRLILDYRQSPEVFSLIKKMIGDGDITARVLDLETAEAEDYNQHTEPKLLDHTYTTLIVEDYAPRAGMLSQLIIVDYIGQHRL